MRKLVGIILLALLTLSLGLAAAEASVKITNANFKAPSPEKENLNGEWVEVTNQGADAQNLDGGTLGDLQNHVYTFKGFVLDPGATVKVHTGTGDSTKADLYWGRKIPIWNNKDEKATLKDPSGNVICEYPEAA